MTSSGSVPLQRRLELAAVLAQLGLDVGHPEQRVDLGLGRAAVGDPGAVVEHAVLGDVQAAPDGEVAQRDVVLLGAGQVLEHVAELVGLDDPQIDADARVGPDSDGVGARVWRRPRPAAALPPPAPARRVGGGRDDVEVLDGLGHPPRRAGELGLVGGRVRADRREQLLADRERAARARSAAPVRPRA